MKISIRFSILTLFGSILLMVGMLIIMISYFAVQKILTNSSQQLLYSLNGQIEFQTTHYLQPLVDYTQFTGNLIEKKFIDPKKQVAFEKFLLDTMQTRPNIYIVVWGDSFGNSISLEKYQKDIFIFEEDRITPAGDIVATAWQVDKTGKIVEPKKTTPGTYNASKRPWFIEAEAQKKQIMTDVYVFQTVGFGNVLGITSAMPVYDSTGKLYGIFEADTTLKTISAFINGLRTSKNSQNIIVDENQKIVAAPKYMDANELNIENGKVPTLAYLDTPELKEAYSLYLKNNDNLFSYKFDDKLYVASFKKYQGLLDINWVIGIVMPLSDIVGPLQQSLLISLLWTIVFLSVGLLLGIILSTNISKPIKKLAEEAKQITQLNLSSQGEIKSHIKEIINMRDAFVTMKRGLQSFIRYVPITLVKNLMARGEIAKIGGQSKVVTFLFSDIKGFTSISETMSPQQLTIYLSDYFERMTSIILDKKGMLDKYIGDAIMAFWGAPVDDNMHAQHACESALGFYRAIKELNEKWRANGQPEISFRVGISTGEAIVGNVGSNDRLNYTAIGDSVNLTSRLEQLNKLYGTRILVSQFTHHAVQDKFNFRLVDCVMVRGKTQSVYVYELLDSENSYGAGLENYNISFKVAFALYQKGDFVQALLKFNELANQYPDDTILKVFISRCEDFKNTPPTDWKGIWAIR